MRRGHLFLAGAFLVVAVSGAKAAEDDLSLVKRAVAADTGGTDTTRGVAAQPARKGPSPQWFRVRITEKGNKKAKVSINLPLALVKAIGDDAPLDWHCPRGDGAKKEGRCSLRLSEVLKTLDSGQDFVQIEDEDSSIRVYVE